MGAIVAIVNPNSADGATGRRWPKTASLLREGIGAHETVFTSGPEMAISAARAAVRAGASLIIAVGGDGTLNEVINGFFDEDGAPIATEAAVGLIPAGTGGDFRRTAGIPVDTKGAVRCLARPRRRVDVGRLIYTTPGGGSGIRHFINVASCGVSGLVDRYANQGSKRLGGKISFVLASLRALSAYRDRRVRVRFDDGPTKEMAITSLAVANGQYFGGGMWVAPQGALDDGVLEVTIWSGFGVSDFVFKASRLYNGTHLALAGASAYRARKVVVESEQEVLLDVDGEQVGVLPATWQVLPGALRMQGVGADSPE
jgi:YegS/Rv2252/BmrU family lipid kinase